MGRMVIAETPCPKCGGTAWYESPDEEQIHFRHSCGFLQVVYVPTPDNEPKIVKNTPKRYITMPKPGTKLSKTLGIAAQWHPETVTTGQVAEQMNDRTTDVGQRLMVLRHKGLVNQLIDGKGVLGGSTWGLTAEALKRLGLGGK